uniref:CACN subunit beta associated regulatory protein n=1 Tax=Tetraodon nigroviridis TaxID=99883 RepID=H3CZ77_TETNG
RYTLTEGDFHHLKNARLTHLHIPPPALNIVTIHECESVENSITVTTHPVAKSALSIFQPMLCPLPQTALTSTSVSPSSALPGDALNSVVDPRFNRDPPVLATKEPSSVGLIEMLLAGPRVHGSSAGEAPASGGVAPAAGGSGASQGPMLQFFTKLRRHASLEGASPYFKIKKWKLDSSQRASSLDTRGSPKRRHFQRQRAASESMDQDDSDMHHIDLVQYIARTQDVGFPSRPANARRIAAPSTPPPSLGRLEVEVMVEPNVRHGGPAVIGLSPDPQDEAVSPHRKESESPSDPPDSLYKDIWSLRATLEQYDQSSNNDRNSICTGGPHGSGQGGSAQLHVPRIRGRPRSANGETGTRKLLQMDSGYASIEGPSRGPEDLRLFGSVSGSPKDRTAHPLRLHRRDYSIDEKTDALFHEFLRHDPQFDQQESPRKHRSRIHLRKQWQRHKQWSDPGVRHFHSSFERQRTPLRRGESVNYPLDASYHSTLPRIVSAPDEETSEGTASGPETPKTITAELTDKLTTTLDERLYSSLRRSKDAASECATVTAAYASPDHSPV